MKPTGNAAVTPARSTTRARTKVARHENLAALLLLLAVSILAIPAAATDLSVTYYNVGPGNCVLVECPTVNDDDYINLIIDCGSHKTDRGLRKAEVINEISYALGENLVGRDPWSGDESIVTHFFLTHPDQDHYNYLDALKPAQRYLIGTADGYEVHEGTLSQVYTGGFFGFYKQPRGGSVSSYIRKAASRILGQTNPFEPTPDAVVFDASPYQDYYSRPGRRKRERAEQQYTEVNALALNYSQTSRPQNLGLCGLAEIYLLAGNSDPGTIGVEDSNKNSQSLILALKYLDKVFIFPGDATNGPERGNALQKALDAWAWSQNQNLANYTDYDEDLGLDVDFMMAAHHGSTEHGSDWDGWARVTQPKVVIFSADPTDKRKAYWHPKKRHYDVYSPYLQETAEQIPLTYRERTVGVTNDILTTEQIQRAALGLYDTGDLKITVDGTTGDVTFSCQHLDNCQARLEPVVPEDDESAHSESVADSVSDEDSFAVPGPAGGPSSVVAPAGWILNPHRAEKLAPPTGLAAAQVVAEGAFVATERGALGALDSERTYSVSARMKAEGSGGDADVTMELVALDFDAASDAFDSNSVLASTSATLTTGTGWQNVGFFFTPDADHVEMAKDLAVRVGRSDALLDSVTVEVDRFRVVETRLFDENFESPIVDGYLEESMPAADWIACTNSLARGLSNEELGESFETPFGQQAFALAAADSGLTTQRGSIGTLIDGQTYNVSFDVKSDAESAAEYVLELVAFTDTEGDDARGDCVARAGTVLATARGLADAGSEWTSVELAYEAQVGDAEIEDDLGLRIVNENGTPILYDDIRLTVSEGTLVNPDDEPPVLILTPDPGSDDHYFHPNGSNYFPPVAVCSDAQDGEFDAIVTGEVFPDIDGRYDQTFRCEDTDGNVAQRTVETEVHTPEWRNCPQPLENSQKVTSTTAVPAPEVVDGDESTFITLGEFDSWLGTREEFLSIDRVEADVPAGQSYTILLTEDPDVGSVNYIGIVGEDGILTESGPDGFPMKRGRFVHVIRQPDQTISQLAEVTVWLVCEDTDFDGIPNQTDPDDDNDGVPDSEDDRPRDPTETVDTDGDYIGNNADPDDDGDDVLDEVDNCPLDPNPLQEDSDNNGVGDACEPPPEPVIVNTILSGSRGATRFDCQPGWVIARAEVLYGRPWDNSYADSLTGVSFACAELEPDGTLDESVLDSSPIIGDDASFSAGSVSCEGRLVTGWRGRKGGVIDQFGFKCSTAAQAFSGISDPGFGTPVGGAGGSDAEAACPLGAVVTGARVSVLTLSNGEHIRGIEATCTQLVDAGGDMSLGVDQTTVSLFGGHDTVQYTCQDGWALSQTDVLYGRIFDTSYPDSLTGVSFACAEILPDDTLDQSSLASSPVIGDATEYSSGTAACGGRFVTGLRGHEGEVIDRLGLHCSTREQVASGTFDAALGLPVGGAGGTYAERACPVGSIGTGVKVSYINLTYGAHINRIELICDSPFASDSELSNGEARTGLTTEPGEQLHFFIDLPADVSNLRIEMSGGSGDGDLYVRHLQPPTLTEFDCAPYEPGNDEICTFGLAAAGTWHILLDGYNGFEGVELVATWDETADDSELGNGEPVDGLGADSGQQLEYSFEVPEGASNLRFEIAGSGGDADLYVRYGAPPTLTEFDCRPYTSSSTESCVFSQPAAGTWYVVVRAYQSFADLTLTASYDEDGAGATLENGEPRSGLTASAGQQLEYVIEVPEGATDLIVGIAAAGGDADLYVRYGSPPTLTDFDCRPYTSSSTENCYFSQPAAGTWYVTVRAYQDFADLTLTATYNEDGGAATLQNGVPRSGLTASAGQQLEYVFEVPAGASNLRFDIAASGGDADLYVRHGSPPTLSTYDCRPYTPTSTENCTFALPAAGTWHVMVRAYASFSNLTLTAAYDN